MSPSPCFAAPRPFRTPVPAPSPANPEASPPVVIPVQAERGTTLRTALLEAGVTPHNGRATLINCRGLGTCGTCAVEVQGAEEPEEWTTQERLRLNFPPHGPPGNQRLRLACQVGLPGAGARQGGAVGSGGGWWLCPLGVGERVGGVLLAGNRHACRGAVAHFTGRERMSPLSDLFSRLAWPGCHCCHQPSLATHTWPVTLPTLLATHPSHHWPCRLPAREVCG